MRLQSIGIDDECVKVTFGDGEKERLGICPFPECGLYHAEELAVCDTTGKSITEEVIHQEEDARREKAAREARTGYRNKHLYGWRNNLWIAVPFLIFILPCFCFLVFRKSAVTVNAATFIAGAALLLTMFLFYWEERRQKQITNRADAIFQRVLKGGEAEEC